MKNVIVYLTRSTADQTRQLILSIYHVAENILPWSPADIFVFHEKDFDKSLLLADKVVAELGVKLAEVDFSAIPPEMEGLPAGKRGYRHMCHFFANDIFLRPELQAYDYQMRLDVDSYILSPVRFNVFAMMQTRGMKYVYRMVMRENRNVSQGLLETCERYFREHPERISGRRKLNRVNLYYTNFEICDLKWFRDRPWQDFFAAIDEARGIYRYRWGDAPIRWLGLQHLLQKREIYCLRGMAYFHAFKLEKWLTFRLPWEYARYALSIIKYMLHNRKNAKVV